MCEQRSATSNEIFSLLLFVLLVPLRTRGNLLNKIFTRDNLRSPPIPPSERGRRAREGERKVRPPHNAEFVDLSED